MTAIPPIFSSAAPPSSATQKDTALRKAAVDLESAFLAEMLKSAGLGESRSSFGGGAGEDQFGSFLIRAQADEIAKSGGIGLAEALFDALKEQTYDT